MQDGRSSIPAKQRSSPTVLQEIAHESEAERRVIEAELLIPGRPANAVDRIAIETLSAAMVRARRLRAMGRNNTEQIRLIAQLLAYQNETSAAGLAIAQCMLGF